MAQGYQALTDKEKQTLRLLLSGHDAKSLARHLGLSVHTVNERLRDARRKLSASSSREAARVLRDAEGPSPEMIADKQLGDAMAARPAQSFPDLITGKPPLGRAAWIVGGLAMILFVAALLASNVAPDASSTPADTVTVAESTATRSARQWLELVDASKWQESWAATGDSFRAHNTVERWQSASMTARVPLGQMLSRTLVSEQSAPTPPNGNQIVKFRTDFANKSGAIETIALVREGGSWHVAGIYID